MIQNLKKSLFPKGLKRSSSGYTNRFFRRVAPGKLEKDLTALGLVRDDIVCVHSSLSGIGFLTDGSQSVITALRRIVGGTGTLMMPTFTGGGSTYAYVTSGPAPFEKDKTPSTTGLLSEIFRQLPGVERSLHPTHSVAVLGPEAGDWIEGHENSTTPFGDNTPYDRLIHENGKVLLLNVNANSLMHRIQEIIDWPNLYLDELFLIKVMDGNRVRTVETAVHSPGPFSHMVLPGKGKDQVRFVHIPAYAIPFFPGQKENDFFQQFRGDAADFLKKRLKWLLDEGIVRKGNVGYGQAVLLNAGLFAERLTKDMHRHLSLNPNLYHRNRLKKMKEKGTCNGAMSVI